MNSNSSNNSRSLVVWTRFEPTSADPMDYDLSVHHITMRSVFASLVSIYKGGEVAPQIAKSWSNNSDATEWILEIDENWNFENGEKITPELVKKSLQRVLYLKNKQNSQSGLLEFLEEANQLRSISDNISGLSITNNKLKFKFIKPMFDFLEKISFGMYGIAHPANYEPTNGEWVGSRNVVSSGAYRIESWSKNVFVLKLRENLYINKLYKKSIYQIVFNFSKNPVEMHASDIIIKEKINPSIDKSQWTYASTTQDNNISYIKVMKWNNSKSELSKREVREKLRNIFYQSLEVAGFSVTTSFFPLSIKGIKSFDYSFSDSFDYLGREFSSQPFFTTPNGKELGDIYKNGFELFGKKINAKARSVDYPEKEEDESKIFDIQFLATGIVIDYPIDDIKFMFLSEQGIKLPDETGEIKQKLKDDKFDIQEINKLIWEQAIIWPVRHYSMGFWTKNESYIDTSELNLTAHPIDFQFLKWK